LFLFAKEKNKKIKNLSGMQSISSREDFQAQTDRFASGIFHLDRAFAKQHARGLNAPDLNTLIDAATQHANGFVDGQRTTSSTLDQEMLLWHRIFLSRLACMLDAGQTECPPTPQAQPQPQPQPPQVQQARTQQQQSLAVPQPQPKPQRVRVVSVSLEQQQLDDASRMLEEQEREMHATRAPLPPSLLTRVEVGSTGSLEREQQELEEVTRILDDRERSERIHQMRVLTSRPIAPQQQQPIIGRGADIPKTAATTTVATTTKTATATNDPAACGTLCQAKAKALAAAKVAADAARATVSAALQRVLQLLLGQVKDLYAELGQEELRKWAEHLCGDLGIAIPPGTNITDASAIVPVIMVNLPLIMSKLAVAGGAGADSSPTATVAKIQAIVQRNIVLGAQTAERLLVQRAELRFQQQLAQPATAKQVRAAAQAFGVKADDANTIDVLKRLVPVLDNLVKNGLTAETMAVLLPKLLLLKANAVIAQ